MDDDDLVQTTVYGLPPSWETFISSVNDHEVHPRFERLWHDCMQEEGRIQGRNGPVKEENFSLAAKTKKGKKFAPQKNY